ncbi:hypothetical protein ID866_10338 [Astraeus odoratus]|nr:hypothetical protein ID866_10338 [Astraeus odoratus]
MWFDLFLFAIAAYLVKKVFWSRKPPAPLPPGPKPLPLLGNYFDVPSRGLRATYTEWATKFGDISYVKIFRNRLVVVNSSKVATNMLDKKGAKYSDRPVVPMAGELVGGKDMLSFAQYGDRFRETRKLSHRAIGSPTAAASYQGIQEAQTRKFLQRLYASPEKLSSHIRTNAGALILKIVYGYEVKEENDPFVNLVENAIRAIATAVITGTFLVDAVPILKYVPEWFPGAGFKVQARKWNVLIQDMANKPFQLVKERMAAGTAVRSFTSDLLEGRSLTSEDEFLVKWAAASMYAGGGDTTVGSIYAFFLAMTLFPEIQKKAQAEIDAVVGSERLPTFADRERLPYIDAIVKEVLRWHVIFPLGMS